MTSTTVFTTSTVETTEEPVVSLGDDDELKPNLDEFDRVDESDEETNTDDVRFENPSFSNDRSKKYFSTSIYIFSFLEGIAFEVKFSEIQ